MNTQFDKLPLLLYTFNAHKLEERVICHKLLLKPIIILVLNAMVGKERKSKLRFCYFTDVFFFLKKTQ